MKKFLLVVFLISTQLFAQDEVKVNLSNPNSTIYTHLYFLQPESYDPQKAAKTIFGYEEKEAESVAIKLKQILDGRGLKVDFSKVPVDPMYADTTDYKNENKYVLFPFQMPQIYIEKKGENWHYSDETVKLVNELYDSVYPWYTEKIQSIVPSIGHKSFLKIELWQYLGVLIIILVCSVLFFILHKIVFYLLKKIQFGLIHISNESINIALKKLSRPLVLLILMGIIESVLPSLMLNLEVNKYLFLGLDIMTTVFWIYVFLKLVEVLMSIYGDYAKSTDSKLDDQLVPILNNFLTGIVIFLGFLKLLTLFGIEPTAVIAGASIGGLAVALASQDTVKNLIGTIMIFLDKPFHIGDWIEAGTVVGTVEQVGFRSTRLRAADTSVYQIPNSTLSEMAINNKGLRAYRRYTTNLGVRYDTPPELIEAFISGIRKIIKLHSGTRDDAFNVEFIGFGDSALLIMVNVYFKASTWNLEQSSKHSLHMSILKLAAELGVEFAFPSSTLMIEQFPDKSSLAVKYNTDESRVQKVLNDLDSKEN